MECPICGLKISYCGGKEAHIQLEATIPYAWFFHEDGRIKERTWEEAQLLHEDPRIGKSIRWIDEQENRMECITKIWRWDDGYEVIQAEGHSSQSTANSYKLIVNN